MSNLLVDLRRTIGMIQDGAPGLNSATKVHRGPASLVAKVRVRARTATGLNKLLHATHSACVYYVAI